MSLRMFFLLFCFSIFCSAQNLSGLWVHDLDSVNAVNNYRVYAIMYLSADDPENITGYTFDYQVGSTCSFSLNGTYEPEKKRFKAVNKKKIQKSFFHGRGKYTLFYEEKEGEEYLVGRARQKGVHGFVMSFGGVFKNNLIYRKVKPEEYDKVYGYNIIKPYIDSSIDVFEQEFPETTTEENTAKEIPIIEVEETKDIRKITRKKKRRKDKLIQSHNIQSRTLILEILDKKYEDGDRVSIYVNEVLFQFNVEVKNEAQIFELTLPSDRKTHKILFVANNLGKLPPNTATIRYTIDGTKHESTLSTDKKENKYLEFIIQY